MSSEVGSTPCAITTLPAGAAPTLRGTRTRETRTTAVRQWLMFAAPSRRGSARVALLYGALPGESRFLVARAEDHTHAQGADGSPDRGVRAGRLLVPGAGDERGARSPLPRAVRGPRCARFRHQEDEDEVAPALPVGAGDRRGPAHPRHLRGPDRAEPPLLEHGLAREEGRWPDLRGLAPGLRLRGGDPGGARGARALGVRRVPGVPPRGPRLAQVGHPETR